MACLKGNKTRDKRKVDFSVCVSTYNSAKTLRVCLDSIFQQTVKPTEVLVCDGGSTDGTLEILKEYPVKVVATDVRGVGSARNVLAFAVSEKMIAWIDSDVAIPVNWLELREEIHQAHPEVDCLSNAGRYVNTTEANEISKIPISSEIVLKQHNEISHGTLTIKRELYQKVGGYDPLFEWGEDWDLKTRLLRIGAGIYWTETCLSYHMRSEKFVKSRVGQYILLHDLEPRKFILAGNFLCFLFKYGLWYVRSNPRHLVTFLLRLWLLYSLLEIAILPRLALISLSLAVIANLLGCKLHHKRLRVGFLLEQVLKAVGEHRNLLRSIVYRWKHRKTKL